MSFSIRFDIPLPPVDPSESKVPQLLIAIRSVAVDRFGGEMHVLTKELPSLHGLPARPAFQVTLSFDESVNPLEVTRAIDEVYDRVDEHVAPVRTKE